MTTDTATPKTETGRAVDAMFAEAGRDHTKHETNSLAPAPEPDAKTAQVLGQALKDAKDQFFGFARAWVGERKALAVRGADVIASLATLLGLLGEAPTLKVVAGMIREALTGVSDPKEGLTKSTITHGRKIVAVIKDKEQVEYRQYGAMWYDLARWERGQFHKTEIKTPKVTIKGVVYERPVPALRDGLAMTTVYASFRSVIRPGGYDLAQLSAYSQAYKVARSKDTVSTFGVILKAERTENGKKVMRKKRFQVIADATLAEGSIIGLLENTMLREDNLMRLRDLIDEKLTNPAEQTEAESDLETSEADATEQSS